MRVSMNTDLIQRALNGRQEKTMMKKVAPLAIAALLGTAIATLVQIVGHPGSSAAQDANADRYVVRCFLELELEKKLNELAKADDWRVVSVVPSQCQRSEAGQAVKKPGVLVILER
jgi:hypothetical protein